MGVILGILIFLLFLGALFLVGFYIYKFRELNEDFNSKYKEINRTYNSYNVSGEQKEQIEKRIKEFKDESKKGKRLGITKIFSYSMLSFTLLLAFIFIPFGFVQVEAGEIAVVKVFGDAKEIKTEGLYFRNIISEKYDLYDLKTQDVRSNFEAYTNDGQAVTVQLTVQFRIKPDKVLEIVKQFGSLEVLKQRIDVVGIVSTKEVISTYEALPLIQSRNVLSTEVSDNIGNAFNEYHIDVTQILITDIAFTPLFEDIIEQNKLAEQQLNLARTAAEKALIEAQNKVELAEQKALERLAQAQGEADAVRAMAQAEADQIELLAKAEAEQLRLKSIELARSLGINILVNELGKETIDSDDPNINQLSAYLQYIAYLDAWDGKLPEIILGDGVTPIIPLP